MHVVVLEDRRGRTRTFPLGPGFWVEGKPVELTAPVLTRAPARPTRTASGSVAVHGEKVWGDDLRVEGVVVEMLDGVDHLAERLAEFGPDAERRVGVLVDHL